MIKFNVGEIVVVTTPQTEIPSGFIAKVGACSEFILASNDLDKFTCGHVSWGTGIFRLANDMEKAAYEAGYSSLAVYKQALLREAKRRFPSPASYVDVGTSTSYRDILYDEPCWWDYCIALRNGCGIVYKNGVWAIAISQERVEVFSGIFIGDIVVSLRDGCSDKRVGKMFEVLPNSSLGYLCYKEYCSRDPRVWRKATQAETLQYRAQFKSSVPQTNATMGFLDEIPYKAENKRKECFSQQVYESHPFHQKLGISIKTIIKKPIKL